MRTRRAEAAGRAGRMTATSTVAGIAGLAMLGTGASLLSPQAAMAGDLHWDTAKQFGAVSVRDRPRDGLQPDGIRIGNYVLLPEVGFRSTWNNDSRFATDKEPSDFRHELHAGFEFRSHLPRHLLDMKAELRAGAERDTDELRDIDTRVRIVGRLDIDHAHSLFGEASYVVQHDDDIDAEQPENARRASKLAVTRLEGGLRRSAGRIDAAIGARYTRFNYQDAQSLDGDLLDQDARDFTQIDPFVQLGWRISPGYRLFGEVSARHQENRGDGRISRDAEGVQAGLGIEFEVSPLVRVMLKGGYLQQDYQQAGLIDISTPVYEARVDWYVTPLVSLTFGTRRSVDATTFGEASGRIVTAYNARADYEMWRNLIITGEASLRTADFIGENRTDTIWSGRLGLEYTLSQNWLVTLGYEHQQLSSSDSEFDRDVDKITIGAKYRY